MSYGAVYIESDIKKLKKAKYSKTEIIKMIGRRLRARYNDYSVSRSENIARGIIENKQSLINFESDKKRGSYVKLSAKELKIERDLNLTHF